MVILTSKPNSSLPDADSKPRFVQEGFNTIAPRYDLLNDLMTGGLHRRWKNEAVRRLELRPGMRILDLCSGTGDLAARAVRALEGEIQVTALDFSTGMMQAGRHRWNRKPYLSRIDWTCADACKLPFQEQVFDGALVGFGLRNVASMDQTFQDVIRVLKPGAIFLSLDTAGAEWPILQGVQRFYMNRVVPLMGSLLAGSRKMYSYLSASAEAFTPPQELEALFKRHGYVDTGYAYRPRMIGGAALVWGRKPYS